MGGSGSPGMGPVNTSLSPPLWLAPHAYACTNMRLRGKRFPINPLFLHFYAPDQGGVCVVSLHNWVKQVAEQLRDPPRSQVQEGSFLLQESSPGTGSPAAGL
uniref:Uncharacterized protein n=1 Tax=Sphaerodactylus townsendi TaxID=933632 RepID=A0ACB8G851_9SAUR